MIEEIQSPRKIELTTFDFGGGVINLTLPQVEAVRRRLDEGSIYYWVDSITIHEPGKEPKSRISISRNADMDRVRALLDDLL